MFVFVIVYDVFLLVAGLCVDLVYVGYFYLVGDRCWDDLLGSLLLCCLWFY